MPQFGGFMNDQTAQMGFQVGQKAVMAGQEYMEQSVCRENFTHLFFSHARSRSQADYPIDKSLRLDPSSKTLLQCQHPICPPQNPPRPLSMAP